ncbi:MAG: hypothetical protein WCJ39_01830 [bacterium]
MQQLESYTQRFVQNVPDKKLSLTCASRDIPELIEQIKHNDILFFCGGKPYKYFEVIDQIQGFRSLVKNKIIAGTS